MSFRIPLARPDISDVERRRVADVLDSDTLSRGPALDEFERRLADQAGRRHAIGLSSGTAALHLALLALDVGPGLEVITTPFSVPASVNPILAVGARPRFVDIDCNRRALDPALVEPAINELTRAILAVHPFGQPADIQALESLANQYHLPLIEDACEALGSRLKSGPLGSFGAVSAFGFYPNKPLTTGEGGAALTDDSDLADRIRLLANHGRSMNGNWLDQVELGFNYRLSELHAAVGLGQLDRIDHLLGQRRRAVDRYAQRLSNTALTLPTLPADCIEAGWFAWVVTLPDSMSLEHRDQLVIDAARQGIQLGRYFAPLHRQPALIKALGNSDGKFPVTEHLADRSLALPLFSTITDDEIDQVCDFLEQAMAAIVPT